MGYVSQVFSAVQSAGEVHKHLTVFAVTHPKEWEVLRNWDMVVWDEDVVVLSVDCIKWYDGYKHVDAWRCLYRWFEAQELEDTTGCFVRLGEDEEDQESEYFGGMYAMAYIQREIAIDIDVPTTRKEIA